MVGMRSVLLIAALGLVAASCDAASTPRATGSGPTSRSTVPVCQPEFRPPAAFAERGTFTVPESDHVGKRVSYTDAYGRTLVFASGISGEFGEGEPVAGALSITSGEQARLLGRDSAWFVVWSGDAPCLSKAVIGRGLGRRQFIRLLERSGVVAPGS